MRLNKEELIIASILTAIVVPWPWVLVAIPVCALLWALSGDGKSKLFRRLGVPLVWAFSLHTGFAFVCVLTGFLSLCIGYGLPSTQPPDEGSALGRFFWKLTGGNVLLSNILTRGLIYIGLVIPFLIVRFLG